MSSSISRRDFLKLLTLISAGSASAWTTARFLPGLPSSNSKKKPNIIILVTDTTSATNLSVYGYSRRTTSALEKLAERSTVYHSHYSGGSFTTAGTATLLTGKYPWSHRAINQMGLVNREIVNENIFDQIGNEYYRFAFTQNMAADVLLGQFYHDIDQHLQTTSFSLRPEPLVGDIFRDSPITLSTYDDFLLNMQNNPGLPGSLFLGLAYKAYHLRKEEGLRQNYAIQYPRGLPIRRDVSLTFLNEVVYGGLDSEIRRLMNSYSPFFAYFHLWSPHEPYNPRKEFMSLFQDKYEPIKKPNARLGDGIPNGELNTNRGFYDRYIANVDDEIGKLLDSLEQAGLLENSYVIYTSDHGQMHERGILGHITPHLYEPLIHIPLIISGPGQSTRRDIHTSTSSIDIVPTLMQIAGKEIPTGGPGRVLPGLGGIEDNQRSIFSVEAKTSSAFAPLARTTIAMIKGASKLIYYKGYSGYDNIFELYDLNDDIEEMKNLAPMNPANLASLKDELLENLSQADRPFRKKQ